MEGSVRDVPADGSLVDAVIASANGREGAALSGVAALLLVSALGPVGGAAWLATVRQDCGRFLRREVRLSVVFVPIASLFTFGLAGALWRAVVLAPLVEEVQARAGIPRPSVRRARYALPLLHAVFVQEDLSAAWIASRGSRLA
jgi:hypothetical protein